MIPIEHAHYNAWADRLQAALADEYPRMVWLVLHDDEECIGSPDDDVLRRFQIVAMTMDGSRQVDVQVPVTFKVDEEVFGLAVVALGRKLERRLAAMPDGFDVP